MTPSRRTECKQYPSVAVDQYTRDVSLVRLLSSFWLHTPLIKCEHCASALRHLETINECSLILLQIPYSKPFKLVPLASAVGNTIRCVLSLKVLTMLSGRTPEEWNWSHLFKFSTDQVWRKTLLTIIMRWEYFDENCGANVHVCIHKDAGHYHSICVYYCCQKVSHIRPHQQHMCNPRVVHILT